MEKEMLAMIWGVHFRNELLANNDFKVLSDSKSAIKILNKEKPPSSLRIASWLSKLPSGNYKAEHVPCKDNISDYISRCLNVS